MQRFNTVALRINDVIISLIVFAFFSPLLFIISLWIALDSRGGVFFRQERIGQNGVSFKLLKFRSMKSDSERKGYLTVGNRDSRITKSGYFIRKYKMDELPQLINVLKGDMSLVGPRPEVKKYTDLYTTSQRRVLDVKPGITDNASIEFFNENEILSKSEDPEMIYINEIMPLKLELNLKYIENQSLQAYYRIIFKTFIKVIG